MAADARVVIAMAKTVETLAPENLAAPGGHYSHAARFGDLIFTAGARDQGRRVAYQRARLRGAGAASASQYARGGAGRGGGTAGHPQSDGLHRRRRQLATLQCCLCRSDGREASRADSRAGPELHYGYLVEVDAVAVRGFAVAHNSGQ